MNIVPYRNRGVTRFHNEMDDLFHRFFGGWEYPIAEEGTYWPVLDLSETEENVVVKAELPGLQAEDINISVQGNTLSITGEKKHESQETKDGYYHSERRFGRFRRDLALPSHVDADKVGAEYKDGVLTVTMPKAEAERAKTIKVKT